MESVKERFLRYVSYDTESADFCEQVPSTEKQFELARLLAKELEDIGVQNVRLSEHCYVYGDIPASPGKENLPALGFIAHMDTSTAVSGKDVKPVITPDYDGGDIRMSEEYTLSPSQFPELLDYVGQEIICTDGSTLLGADDKAGVAEIMAMAERLCAPDAPAHCAIRIGFTPDEEVGRGVDFFDVEGFGAKYAYTVDGGPLGDVSYETFNAAGARVKITGTSVHPGSAHGRMVSAVLVAMELQDMLPRFQNPASTENYEGFFHLDNLTGSVDSAEMYYIIRDHDRAKFEAKKTLFQNAVGYLNGKYGDGTVVLEMKDQYYNMAEVLKNEMHLIDNVKMAMTELGMTPRVNPIRGGTDGARLCYMGLPCPNLCTGGHNCHGRYEFVATQSMERVVELLLKITEIYSL